MRRTQKSPAGAAPCLVGASVRKRRESHEPFDLHQPGRHDRNAADEERRTGRRLADLPRAAHRRQGGAHRRSGHLGHRGPAQQRVADDQPPGGGRCLHRPLRGGLRAAGADDRAPGVGLPGRPPAVPAVIGIDNDVQRPHGFGPAGVGVFGLKLGQKGKLTARGSQFDRLGLNC